TLLQNHTDASGGPHPDRGATGANLVGTIFDQQASASIVNNTGGAASTGRFRPETGSLSSYNGAPASVINGSWTLQVTDFRNGNTGMVTSWSLRIRRTAGFQIANQTEGASFMTQIASFTDGDPRFVATDFTAQIDWGDHAVSFGGVSGGNGAFNVTGAHNYADEGTYLITIGIMRNGGSATAFSSIT